MVYPDPKDRRQGWLYPMASTFGATRRDALAAWQRIWPNQTWRRAYRLGWRVLRCGLWIDTASTLEPQ